MTLRAVVDTCPSPFHHSSVSHSVSLCFVSPFHWLHGIAIASLWSVPIVWVLFRAAYTVWFRGSWLGGALVSAQCCVASYTHRVRVRRLLWLLPALFFGLTAIPIPRMISWMIQCYHHSSSYRRCWTDQLITVPFLFCGLWLFFVWCLLLVLVVCLFCLCFFCWHRDSSLDYVLVLLQFNFWSPPLCRWMTSLH